MSSDINRVIRDLSEIYDKDSNDTYISLYFSAELDSKFIKKRKKSIESILKGELLDNFKKSMFKVEKALVHYNKGSVAIFSSNKNNFFEIIKLPIKIESTLIVDSSPYIRPLVRIMDEWESFTLVLVSSNYAKIYSISFGEIKSSKSLSKDIINKHKKGGCSQARFNRLRRGAIQQFLKEVVEELQKKVDKQIIIAGPGNTKNHFIDMFPKDLKDKIIDIIDISLEDENRLIKESIHLIAEKEYRQSNEAVFHLKQEILRDGLAVYGLEDTLQAVKNGQVELLIIEKDIKIKGWICEHCQIVKKGYKNHCPYCKNKVSQVDILEEILEFAERTDAEIEFSNDPELKNLGHVGAILRYK